MEKIFTITCNNFFEVSFRDLLHNEFEVDILRLDYDNTNLTKGLHFVEQVRLAHQDFKYTDDLLFSRYDFSFDVELTKRIKSSLKNNTYSSIFLDFRKLNSQAWLLLDFLRFETELPIIVFIPKKLFSENNIVKLSSYKVNNVITDFNYSNIISTLNKYKTP